MGLNFKGARGPAVAHKRQVEKEMFIRQGTTAKS
jgi:hypothetical protein